MRPALLLILGLALAPKTARADTGSLDELVREVIERNPSVRARVLRRDAFHSEARAAGIYPDPQVAVMVDRVPQAREADMPMVRYQATQMFPWPGKLGLMTAAVERQRDAAAADVDLRKLDLRFEAKRAYYMLALNAKRREIIRESRGVAATIAAATLSRYASGLGSHHENARAQVEVTALDAETANLEGERRSMVAMINALRDRPADAAFPDPPGVTPSPSGERSLQRLVERAYAQHPQLRGMRAMQDEASTMADLARRERYPDLMASVWMNQNFGAPPSAGAMLGVTIPLFGVSRQGHRARAFESRALGIGQDAAAMRTMIRFGVADAMVRVETATRRIALIDTVVLPKARESFDTSLTAYGTGSVDLVGVLDARRSLQFANLALAEARVDREVAHAELERALGGAP